MNSIRHNGGQMIVEAVLIIALFFGFTVLIASYFRGEAVYARLVSGPWLSIAGMLQNGSWTPPNVGAALHPSNHSRHSSKEPESPQ